MHVPKVFLFGLTALVGCGSTNDPTSAMTGAGSSSSTGSGGTPNDAGVVGGATIETCTLATDDEVAAALGVPTVTHEREQDTDDLSVACTWTAGTGLDTRRLWAEATNDANERLRWGDNDATVRSHFTDVKGGLASDGVAVPGVGDDAFYLKTSRMLWVLYHDQLIALTSQVFADGGGFADALPATRAVALKMVTRL